jgi:hypothetical protein
LGGLVIVPFILSHYLSHHHLHFPLHLC